MKQQPFYRVLSLLASLLFIISGCTNRTNIPYNQGNVEANIISIKTAQQYTASYRSAATALSRSLGGNYLNSNFQLPVAVQFNRDVLALLLNQADSLGNPAAGVRMYFARDGKNQVTLVLVPIDGANNDIVNKLIDKNVVYLPGVTPAYADQVNGQAVNNALRCPTFCDQLNSGLSGNLIFE